LGAKSVLQVARVLGNLALEADVLRNVDLHYVLFIEEATDAQLHGRFIVIVVQKMNNWLKVVVVVDQVSLNE